MGKPNPAPDKAIHPLQIFKQGVALWQKKFAQLSRIFLVFNLPIFVFSLPPLILGQDKTPSWGWVTFGIILQIATIIAGIWVAVALMQAAVQENAEPLRITLKAALKRFWPFIGASALIALIGIGCVGAGMVFTAATGATMAGFKQQMNPALSVLILAIFLLIWGVSFSALVIFSLRFSLAGFVCVLEQAGPMASLKRSWVLTRKRLQPVLGIASLIGILTVVLMIPALGAVLGTLISGGPKPVIAPGLQVFFSLYSLAVYCITMPLQTCVLLKLYTTLKEAKQ